MKELVLAALIGPLFLHIFYRAVESQWPEIYFGGPSASYAVSASPVRYLAHRFLPVFITCLFVAVSIDRAGRNVVAAVMLVVAGHAGLTTLRGVFAQTVGRERSYRRLPLVLIQCLATLGFVGVGTAAIISRSTLEPLVPPVSDLSATLWTGLVAGVVGVYVLRLSESGSKDRDFLLKASRQSIPPELWAHAAVESKAAGVDATLTHAMMIAENLNRPPWFRRLELLKGKVFPAGTYGIMQVASSTPLSDKESIDQAIHSRLVSAPSMVDSRGWPDSQAVRRFAKTYNDDGGFADLVVSAYCETHMLEKHGELYPDGP